MDEKGKPKACCNFFSVEIMGKNKYRKHCQENEHIVYSHKDVAHPQWRCSTCKALFTRADDAAQHFAQCGPRFPLRDVEALVALLPAHTFVRRSYHDGVNGKADNVDLAWEGDGILRAAIIHFILQVNRSGYQFGGDREKVKQEFESREMCAKYCRDLGLTKFIKASDNDLKSNVAQAECFEAFIAAMCHKFSYECTLKFIVDMLWSILTVKN